MTERLTHCAGCAFELRPQGTPSRPGTRKRATKQLCGTCYTRKARTGDTTPLRKIFAWDDCKNCDRPMRPASIKLADHPGTIAHGKQGYCNTCVKQMAQTGEYGDPNAPRPVSAHQQAVIDLEAPGADTLAAYMRRREARMARAGRIAVIRAKYWIAA